MKSNIQILIVLMIAAVCSAQEASSVEQIMQDLQAVKPGESVSPPVAAPEAEPVIKSEAPLMTEEQAKTLVDDSIRNYAGGEYTPARNGFERVLLAHPDNSIARYFLDKIAQKERGNNEETALDEIRQEWNGMILRDYAIADEMAGKLKLTGEDQSMDVRHLFATVPFENGSYAVYRPNIKKIIVLNTRSNVEKIETIMAALEVPMSLKAGQIEIKTRFVEFSEGALEELGFEWQNISDGQIAGDWSAKSGENLFSDSLRGGGDVFVQPRNIGGAGSEDRATGDWTASRLTDQFNTDAGELKIISDIGPNIDLLIRALDQTSGTDILSAPSVVTRAGQKASIQVGQTHYFPEDFGVGGNEGVILHVSYQNFSEKLMGVDLTVNPKLIKDNLIEMDLNPKVTELLGWRNYQIAPANSAYTYYQYRIGETFDHDPIIARLPIFRHREVKTKVTIQEGSTIGMGGLITEKTETFSDRVPVFGSLPLFGRLFRSEGERNVKRNLMIFVTASKVSPNGRLISEQSFK